MVGGWSDEMSQSCGRREVGCTWLDRDDSGIKMYTNRLDNDKRKLKMTEKEPLSYSYTQLVYLPCEGLRIQCRGWTWLSQPNNPMYFGLGFCMPLGGKVGA